jgi:hypothetical protein
MTRKLKALRIAIGAVAATSVAATSAQAFEMHATYDNDVTITAQQAQQLVLATSSGNVMCTAATFEAALESQGSSQLTAQDLTLRPAFENCQAFGIKAQVKSSGCQLTVANEYTKAHATSLTAWVDLVCTPGTKVEVSVPFSACVFTISEQRHTSHVALTNTPGSPHDALAEVTLAGVAYELHGGLCGHPTTVLTNNGTITGQATVRAYKETATELVTQEGHEFIRSKHSHEQVGVLAT